MCGIFGELSLTPCGGDPAETLAHRGPDDRGFKQLGVPGTPWSVRLDHRRLSIIDLSSLGHQPMTNEDGSVWITFNGEIFNFQNLRRELASAGHQFVSSTDTEVIVHGYEEWGTAVVDHLRGQFAFGIWDRHRRRLVLARDRLGEKPLFYHFRGDVFVFASEIKAILATGRVPVEPDLAAIDNYLTYLYFPPPRTPFRNVRKLRPASCLTVDVSFDGTLDIKEWEYWDASTGRPQRRWTRADEYVDEMRALLQESTRLRLIADVPVGISLSGGIDSSAITAMAAQSRQQVQTFCVGFPANMAFDETRYADIVARHFQADHHVLYPDVASAAHLTSVISHFDEPFGNPTAILQYILTKLMRQYVTVALAGDGGDELFGGYERYRGALLARAYRRLPAALTRGLIARLAKHMWEDTSGRHGFRRLREFAEFGWRDELDMYFQWIAYYSEDDKRALYSPEMARAAVGADAPAFLRAAFDRAAGMDPVSRLGYVDLLSFLSCNCLEYGDRMSMANGLEVRCPFTDHKLVEFAFSLPPAAKIHGLRTKWIVKKAVEGVLPREVLKKRKVGFNPPAPAWLANELRGVVAHFLSPEAVARRGLFRPAAVARIQRDHYSSRRDNTFKIWSLLMLELWFRMYVEGESEESVRMQILDLIPPRQGPSPRLEPRLVTA